MIFNHILSNNIHYFLNKNNFNYSNHTNNIQNVLSIFLNKIASEIP